MKYLIANWKANKNLEETKIWISDFSKLIEKDKILLDLLHNRSLEIIICPSFPLLILVKEAMSRFPNITVGSQDVSMYDQGTYTGEVTARTLKGICAYSIIGHSERKKNNYENEKTDLLKIEQSVKNGIQPIYCTANLDFVTPGNLKIICFEPPEAISKGDGLGSAYSINQTIDVRNKMQIPNSVSFIYGGSVNEHNTEEYLSHPLVNGALIGGASLDPVRFYRIITSSFK